MQLYQHLISNLVIDSHQITTIVIAFSYLRQKMVQTSFNGCLRGIEFNVLDCDKTVSKFEPQSC